MLRQARRAVPAALLAALALFYINEIWKSSKSAHEPRNYSRAEHTKYEAKHDNIFADAWNWTTQDPLSFYTSVLALFTGVLVFVSFIQIRYLIRADFVSRRSSVAARQSAIAAKAAAEVLPKIERAYVFIMPELEWWDPVPHSSGVGSYSSRIGVKFRLENHGKTPAAVESIDARLKILAEPPDNRHHLIAAFHGEKIIPSGESWTPDSSPRNCAVTEALDDDIKNRRAAIWFYGSILYKDVFGNERITRFRWTHSEIMDAFIPRGDAPYNERK
jgi:hypothetical protein